MTQALNRSLGLAALLVSGFLVGCGGDSGSSNSAPPQPMLMPSDPDVAATYQQTCKSCHGAGYAGAPKTGDKAAWEPRMAKGMDVLVENTINGINGMPPLGTCMDCSAEEFEPLIRFMATGE